jgi:hypothetical protein
MHKHFMFICMNISFHIHEHLSTFKFSLFEVHGKLCCINIFH